MGLWNGENMGNISKDLWGNNCPNHMEVVVVMMMTVMMVMLLLFLIT